MNAQQLAAAIDSGAITPDALVFVPAMGDGQDLYDGGELDAQGYVVEAGRGYLPGGHFAILTPQQVAAYHAFMENRPGAQMSADEALRVQPAASVLWAIRNEWEAGGA